MTHSDVALFQEAVWAYYAAHARHDLPWRQAEADGRFDAYKIMVSEIMLQQTQVARVIPKFEAFTARFPDVQSLAAAPLEEVLRLWSGLGYNRRAKFLWQAAQAIVRDHDGSIPNDQAALVALPGIGVHTAGAIRAYSFDEPAVFLETNIRTVFIHHFFVGGDKVADAALLPLVTSALDPASPRAWYWALMDYGTHLKQSVGNLSRASKTYAKQSAFHSSRRKVRGHLLRLLTVRPYSLAELSAEIGDERLHSVAQDLQAEGMIHWAGEAYHLGSA